MPGNGDGNQCVYEGPYGQVRFARVADGTYPAEEFWDRLEVGAQAKFTSLFVAITSNPQLQLINRHQFKQVQGRLFEFKRNDIQMRLFAFRSGNTWYLVNGLSGKKEDDLPQGDVNRALRFVGEAMAELTSGKGANQ